MRMRMRDGIVSAERTLGVRMAIVLEGVQGWHVVGWQGPECGRILCLGK
jgi:hypothetical protein